MRWTRYQLWLYLGLLPSQVWACATCWGADDPFARGLNASGESTFRSMARGAGHLVRTQTRIEEETMPEARRLGIVR